jgi:hypothetical protein
MIDRIIAAMLAVIIQAGKGPSTSRCMPVQLEKKAKVQNPIAARPTREEGKGPESNRSQIITVDRPTDDLRDQVIGGAESNRSEPKEKKIIDEPGIDRREHHALDRQNEKHELGRSVQPRKPQKRA